MKKYIKPTTKCVSIEYSNFIADSLRSTTGNADLNYGGGSTEDARARQYDTWNNGIDEHDNGLWNE